MKTTDYTDNQIRKALCKEYEDLCHDDFNPEEDMTQREYEDFVLDMNTEQLIEECSVDDRYYTLKDFMDYWGDKPNE